MPSYSFRNRYNKVIRGTVTASSEDGLFHKIDDQADPFSFEYCKVTRNTVWFDENPVWLMFDPQSLLDTDVAHALIEATDVVKEIIDSLKKKLSEKKFDDYTCFVMARRDLDNDDLIGAINRIRVDMDKLICLDDTLYQYVQHLINDFLR